jgi:hypothetical protein
MKESVLHIYELVFLEEHILGVNQVSQRFKNGLKYFLSVSSLHLLFTFFTITIFAKHQNIKRASSLYHDEKKKRNFPVRMDSI